MAAGSFLFGLIANAVGSAVAGGAAIGTRREQERLQADIEQKREALQQEKEEFGTRFAGRQLERQEEAAQFQQETAMEDVEQAQRDVKSSAIQDLVKGRMSGRMQELRQKQEGFLRRGGQL